MTLTERLELGNLIDRFPQAAPGLLSAIEAGAIWGCNYFGTSQDPSCCLYGHVARLMGLPVATVLGRPTHLFDRMTPLESLVVSVRPGDTPATKPVLAEIVAWFRQTGRGRQ